MKAIGIEVFQGDITHLEVDVIVNAANSELAGGGGVDGAIHRAAGPELLKACLALGGCPTGEVKMTAGFNLPARHVIHAVGPVWNGGQQGEPQLLASCYRKALHLAERHGLRSIAFPAISCGVYGYPIDAAAEIAVREVVAFIDSGPAMERIIFACFGADIKASIDSALDKSSYKHG